MYGRFSVILEYNGTIMYVPLHAHIRFSCPRPSSVCMNQRLHVCSRKEWDGDGRWMVAGMAVRTALWCEVVLSLSRSWSARIVRPSLRMLSRIGAAMLRGSYALHDALRSMRLTLLNLLVMWSDASERYCEQRRDLLWNHGPSLISGGYSMQFSVFFGCMNTYVFIILLLISIFILSYSWAPWGGQKLMR